MTLQVFQGILKKIHTFSIGNILVLNTMTLLMKTTIISCNNIAFQKQFPQHWKIIVTKNLIFAIRTYQQYIFYSISIMIHYICKHIYMLLIKQTAYNYQEKECQLI